MKSEKILGEYKKIGIREYVLLILLTIISLFLVCYYSHINNKINILRKQNNNLSISKNITNKQKDTKLDITKLCTDSSKVTLKELKKPDIHNSSFYAVLNYKGDKKDFTEWMSKVKNSFNNNSLKQIEVKQNDDNVDAIITIDYKVEK